MTTAQMKTRRIVVESRAGPPGEKASAQLLKCRECNGEEFLIYIIKDHPHLQCVNCSATYCSGGKCHQSDTGQ